MALSWDNIKGLAIFFGPMLLPKLIGYYRSISRASKSRGQPLKPVPIPVQAALYLLFGLSLTYIFCTLPYFAPENIFQTTDSRLQIPVDVLFNRLTATRPNNVLTASDQALRARFVNLESRLLYLQFGPGALADCPFCSSDEPKSYLYYSLPDILWPHIANLAVVAVVTSPSWTGRYGLQWRKIAIIAAGVVGALEVYAVSMYNHQQNARALRLHEMDMFFWNVRIYRLLALGVLDAVLGWVLYLTSTNRAFALETSLAERVEMANRALAAVRTKVNTLSIISNTALRDENLRSRSHAYWNHETRLMREVMEEREVIEGVNDALSNRIKIEKISQDAETWIESVVDSPPIENGKDK